LKNVFYYVKSVNDLWKKSVGFWHVICDVFSNAHNLVWYSSLKSQYNVTNTMIQGRGQWT